MRRSCARVQSPYPRLPPSRGHPCHPLLPPSTPAANSSPPTALAASASSGPTGSAPKPRASSSALVEVDVDLVDGRRLELLLKGLGPWARTPAARGAKPRFLARAARELDVYRRILDGLDLGTPAFWGGRRTAGRQVLLVEWVAAPTLAELGDLGAWRRAAEWLAENTASI